MKNSTQINNLVILVLICIAQVSNAGNYTWTGNSSTAWNVNGNWSPNTGYPSTNDTATIVTHTNNPLLDANRTVYRLKVTSGTLDLNGHTLTASNTSLFTAGTVTNGTLKPEGVKATFTATYFNATVNAISARIFVDGGTFDQPVTLQDTGITSTSSAGGAIFNSTVAFIKTGTNTGTWGLADDAGNKYNSTATFINNSDSDMYVVREDTTFFNGNIYVGSNSTGSVNIGGFSTDGFVSMLASGKTINIDPTYGFSNGRLLLKRMVQLGTTSQSFTLTSNAVLNIANCTFNASLNFTAPEITIRQCIFNGATTLVQTASTTTNSYGGNTFNSTAVLTGPSSGANYFKMAVNTNDIYNSNVTISGKADLVTNYNATVYGNLTIGSGVNFNHSSFTGTIIFAGSNNQTITGSGVVVGFRKIKIDKTSNSISIDTIVTITDTLKFVKGIINTTSSHLLSFLAGSVVDGTSDSGFVNGPVKKTGNSAFVFPTGKGSYYRAIEISSPSNSTDGFTAEYFDVRQSIGITLDTSITMVSPCNYWGLQRNNGSSTVNVRLYWDFAFCPIADTSDICIAEWNSSIWKDRGTASLNGTRFKGSITNNTTITSYNYFTFGYRTLGSTILNSDVLTASSSSSGQCLPIVSTDFSGKYDRNSNYIPDAKTPVKYIKLNFEIFCYSQQNPNNFPNNIWGMQFLDDVLDGINYWFANPHDYTDPHTSSSQPYLAMDTRIQFTKEVHFYYDDANGTTANTSTSDIYLKNIVNSVDPLRLERLCIMFTEGSFNGQGYTSPWPPSYSNLNQDEFIVTTHQWWYNDETNSIAHLCHEIGHCLLLAHVYPVWPYEICSPETSPEYLPDVFGTALPLPSDKLCLQNPTTGCNPGISSTDFNCTNDIMDGTADPTYRLWFSPLQIGKMTRTLSVYNTRKYLDNSSANCAHDPNPIEITNDETWDFSIRCFNSIKVTNGATLTIKCEVLMPNETKIIVDRGAKLIVDGGTITSACQMWDGIEVWGNPNESQVPYTTNSNQGFVYVKNGSLIEHALTGITAGKIKPNGSIDLSYCGGIVRAESSSFHNCQKAIALYSYHNFVPGNPNAKLHNGSYIMDCRFYTDDNLNFPSLFADVFVLLKEVDWVYIAGNTFENSASAANQTQLYHCHPDRRGNGIRLIDASASIVAYCNNNTIPCTSFKKNVFNNLYFGIKANNSIGTSLSIINNEFYSCNKNIYINNGYLPRITDNQFEITKFVHYCGCNNPVPIPEPTTYGIYINNTLSYICENNILTGIAVDDCNSVSVKPNWGIVINDCGQLNNELYNNTITNFAKANNNQMMNGAYDGSSGLTIHCNDFTDNDFDIQVIGLNSFLGVVNSIQGVCGPNNKTTARNRFLTSNCVGSQENNFRLANAANNVIIYGYGTTSDKTEPVCADALVNKSQCGIALTKTTDCPNHYSNNLPDLIGSINVLTHSIDSIKTLFDGGVTSDLLDRIINEVDSPAAIATEVVSYAPYVSDAVLTTLVDKIDWFGTDRLIATLKANSGIRPVVQEQIETLEPEIAATINDSLIDAEDNSADREATLAELNRQRQERDVNSNLLNWLYLSDTTYVDGGVDSVRKYLALQTEEARIIQLLNLEIANGEFDSASNLLTQTNWREGMENFVTVMQYVISYAQEDGGIYEMAENTADRDAIATIAEDSTKYGYNIARAIMNKVFEIDYPELFLDADDDEQPLRIANDSSIINKVTYCKIYPNPANDLIHIEYDFDDNQQHQVAIYNLQGKEVRVILLAKDSNHQEVKVSDLITGIYIVKLYSNTQLLLVDKLCLIK